MKQMKSDQPVTRLQTMLRSIARVNEAQPAVIPDGVYGEQTATAVRAFQQQHGLNETGVTDYETWEAVCCAYHEAEVETAPAVPLEIELDCNQVILPGSRNRHIYLIQGMLAALSECYPALGSVRMTGIFDEATQNAISWLQGCCELPRSGIFTKKVWQMLTGLYRAKIGNGETEKGLQP